MEFIAAWAYLAVAVFMAAENACIPVPSELILGFAGYLIFSGQMSFAGALTAGMIGGMAGSVFAYLVGHLAGGLLWTAMGIIFWSKRSMSMSHSAGLTSMALRPCFSAAGFLSYAPLFRFLPVLLMSI